MGVVDFTKAPPCFEGEGPGFESQAAHQLIQTLPTILCLSLFSMWLRGLLEPMLRWDFGFRDVAS